jgi:hypothetical protein
VPDEQQACVSVQPSYRVECFWCPEIACQRRVDGKPVALLWLPTLNRQFRGATGAHLGAEQNHVKAHLHPCKCDAGHTCLALALGSQAAL